MTGTQITVYEPKSIAVLERAVRRRLWHRLRLFAGSLLFAQEAVAAYFCAVDPRTPLSVKLMLLGTLAGFLLPHRLIPKALRSLVVGGDIGFLVGALQGFAAHITVEHRRRARLALLDFRRETSP